VRNEADTLVLTIGNVYKPNDFFVERFLTDMITQAYMYVFIQQALWTTNVLNYPTMAFYIIYTMSSSMNLILCEIVRFARNWLTNKKT